MQHLLENSQEFLIYTVLRFTSSHHFLFFLLFSCGLKSSGAKRDDVTSLWSAVCTSSVSFLLLLHLHIFKSKHMVRIQSRSANTPALKDWFRQRLFTQNLQMGRDVNRWRLQFKIYLICLNLYIPTLHAWIHIVSFKGW